MPSKPTFHVHILSTGSAQENVSPPPPSTMTFTLPGSAVEDLLQWAPAPKPQAVYNILKSKLSTWNLNTLNAGEKYEEITTLFVSASGFPSDDMALDIAMERERDIASNIVDRDRWMATEPPGPFPP